MWYDHPTKYLRDQYVAIGLGQSSYKYQKQPVPRKICSLIRSKAKVMHKAYKLYQTKVIRK